MPKSKKPDASTIQTRRSRPALTSEARENQLIALAEEQAEEMLRNHTAPAPVVVHYLKLASTKEKLEKEILEKQKDLISAKTEAIQSAKRMEELYTDAMNAMKRYTGNGGDSGE